MAQLEETLRFRNQRVTMIVTLMKMKTLFVTVMLSLVTFGVAAAELVIEVRDQRGRLLPDAVVWAIPRGEAISPARDATSIMDQRNRTFIPHVLPVQVGTAVRFPNNDNVRHQVYSFSPPKTFQLPLYIGEPEEPVVFDEPGIVSIGCNIHDQMSAWIVVVDTPYFGKTGKSGTVELRELAPSVTHEIHVWHPRIAGQHDTLEVSIPNDASPKTLTVSLSIR